MPGQGVTGYRDVRGKLKIEGDATDPVPIISVDQSDFDVYNEVLAVVTATRTSILSQAHVASTFEKLFYIVGSGEVFATWELELGGSVIDKRRTISELNVIFDFRTAPLPIPLGLTLELFATHTDAAAQDFNATIYGTA